MSTTFPMLSVNGRTFGCYEQARAFATRLAAGGEPAHIMQRDDELFPWFLLEVITPGGI